jgi:hypothetical protein
MLILAAFLFGLLVQIKIYAGILILGGLLLGSILEIFKGKGLSLFKVFMSALIISILIFIPLNNNAQGSVVYQPFWFLETMMGLSDRFNWPKLYEAMVNYKSGQVWLKLVAAYGVSFLIFIVGNFGSRLIGIGYLVKQFRNLAKADYLDVMFFIVIVFGIIFPMFFLQSGTPWNTIQFLYYSLMFSGIIAGITFSGKITKLKLNTRVVYIIEVVLVLITIPTTIGTLWYNYLPARPPAKLSRSELEALNFLKTQPGGTVLTYPYDAILAREAEANPPRPLYLYESTAYVSAYSNKAVFLEDQVNLDITGYDWRGRRTEVENFLNSLDQQLVYDFLRKNNISYVYWLKGQRARLGEAQLGMTRIFQNTEVEVYHVDGVK